MGWCNDSIDARFCGASNGVGSISCLFHVSAAMPVNAVGVTGLYSLHRLLLLRRATHAASFLHSYEKFCPEKEHRGPQEHWGTGLDKDAFDKPKIVQFRFGAICNSNPISCQAVFICKSNPISFLHWASELDKRAGELIRATGLHKDSSSIHTSTGPRGCTNQLDNRSGQLKPSTHRVCLSFCAPRPFSPAS